MIANGNELALAAGYLAIPILLWWPGNWICRAMIGASRTPQPQSEPDDNPVDDVTLRGGRYIGMLERSLIFIGIVSQHWELVAGVVALKSVARYKELDRQINAEYFLIGSLTSILWAILVAFAAPCSSTAGWVSA